MINVEWTIEKIAEYVNENGISQRDLAIAIRCENPVILSCLFKNMCKAHPNVVRYFMSTLYSQKKEIKIFLFERRFYSHHMEFLSDKDIIYLVENGLNVFMRDKHDIPYIFPILKRSTNIISAILGRMPNRKYPIFYEPVSINIYNPMEYSTLLHNMDILKKSLPYCLYTAISNRVYSGINIIYSGSTM